MALSDNLVAYWSLDEASGNAIDAHASNDLTDTNTVGSATGKVGNCRDFEVASSEYFSRADNTDLSTGDIDFTFNCWVQLESKADAMAVIGKWNFGAGQREYLLQYSIVSDRMRFTVSSAGSSASVNQDASNLGSPSTATWYMVTCWHDSVNNLVGIAGNAGTANTTSYSSGVFDGTSAFLIGSLTGTTQTWDGLIDEVGFWKRVLTADERTELYNSGNGRDYAYIVGGSGLAIPIAAYHYNHHLTSMC